MSVEKFSPNENTGVPNEVYDEFIIDTDVHLDLQMLEDLYPYMDMGGGDGHSTPYDDFTAEDGRYRWMVDFIMSGGWEMTVTLTPPGESQQTFRFVGYTVYEP